MTIASVWLIVSLPWTAPQTSASTSLSYGLPTAPPFGFTERGAVANPGMQKILRILNNTALLLLGRFHEIPLADLYAGAIFLGERLVIYPCHPCRPRLHRL